MRTAQVVDIKFTLLYTSILIILHMLFFLFSEILMFR